MGDSEKLPSDIHLGSGLVWFGLVWSGESVAVTFVGDWWLLPHLISVGDVGNAGDAGNAGNRKTGSKRSQ